MYIYGYHDDSFVKVSMSSIRYLTEQLGIFLSVYEKKILLTTDKDKETFEKLKEIHMLLKNQRYDRLITNPSYVINFNVDDEDYLPGYFPIWMFCMLPHWWYMKFRLFWIFIYILLIWIRRRSIPRWNIYNDLKGGSICRKDSTLLTDSKIIYLRRI